MKSKRVVITGLGIFCSIGKNVEDFFQSLKGGRTGIGQITLFDTSKYPSKIGAEIRDYKSGDFFNKKELKRLSRTDQFALIAGEEAVTNSGIHFYSPEEVGVCLGASRRKPHMRRFVRSSPRTLIARFGHYKFYCLPLDFVFRLARLWPLIFLENTPNK